MAVTVTPNLTLLNAGTSTGTTTGNKPEIDSELKKEGSGSVAFIASSNNNKTGFTFTSVDLTNEHIRLWYNSAVGAVVDTKANGGIQFYVTDGSGNESRWYIAGSDTYLGGWFNIVQYLNYTDYPPDANEGTNADLTDIEECGVHIVVTGTIRNVINTWLDYAHYGDGLTAYGDLAGSPFSMEDIYTADLAAGYGVVEKDLDGIYKLAGSIILGDSAGTALCDYDDTNTIIVFSNKPVSSTLYRLEGVGNTTGETDIVFADSVITSGGPLYDLDFDATNLDSLSIGGCQISGADEILLADLANVINTTFNACGLITPNDCYFHDNTVSNGTGTNALAWPGVSGDVEDCKFYDNTNAIVIVDTVTQTFIGLVFSGNTKDVNNTSGVDLTVNNTAGSDASTWATRLVTFASAIGFELTNLIAGTEVRVFTGTPGSGAVAIGGIEVSLTTFSMSHSVGGVAGFFVLINPGYVYEKTTLTFSSLDASYPMKQRTDPNYKA